MKYVKKIVAITIVFLLSLPTTVASAADYTVTENDSLYSLSKLFNTSVKTLRRTNNFEKDILTPGRTIYISAHLYKVKKGDSLYKIASKYKISLEKLKKANWTTGTTIVPGEKLLIPGVKPYKKSDTVIPYTNYEVDLLARLIEAEAGGETYQAKIAVGSVVVNRVQSGEWASTIKGVINQKFEDYYQFTPVKIGTIHNTPSATSKKAAWYALFGSDPSNHAIFYFDQSSKNEWLWSKVQTASIDHLIFSK
ncbi:MAG: LysM peptidoglycan-binding domain-containing protein [Velocimicrobium sp.]